ncbi:uncharacterized protein sowahca [Pholidichthys leucotaenia]
MALALSPEQAVQEFLSERGGKVRQMELIDHFISLWSDGGGEVEEEEEEEEGNERLEEGLRRVVSSVGFVKVENGVKFVCLMGEGGGESGGHGHECNGNIQEEETLNGSCVNGNPGEGGQTAHIHVTAAGVNIMGFNLYYSLGFSIASVSGEEWSGWRLWSRSTPLVDGMEVRESDWLDMCNEGEHVQRHAMVPRDGPDADFSVTLDEGVGCHDGPPGAACKYKAPMPDPEGARPESVVINRSGRRPTMIGMDRARESTGLVMKTSQTQNHRRKKTRVSLRVGDMVRPRVEAWMRGDHSSREWCDERRQFRVEAVRSDRYLRLSDQTWRPPNELRRVEETKRRRATASMSVSLDNDKQSNGNEQPAATSQSKTEAGATTPGGGEVKLRDRRRRESAPVIGVSDMDQTHTGGSHSQHVRAARRISKGSQRAMLTSCLSEDSALEGLDVIGDIHTPKGSRRNFIELMMSSSPQVRRSLINRGSRLRDSVKSDGDSASLLSSATDEDCASVTLDPMEHEWMLCASEGLWESLQPLLAVEPTLVAKRDFVTGFTCLHWAAKQGKAELISQLLSFAKENTIPVNVNVRSSAGYTPLHLAAMHGHTQVVRVLLSDWEADPEARDYSGRRAIQYLSPPLAADLQQQGLVSSPGAESDAENNNSGSTGRGWRFPKVLQGNLNPLRLLNSPVEAAEEATGKNKGGIQRKSSLSRLNARLHRGRHRAQIIHSASFRDSGEVGKEEEIHSSPLRTRPLSNLFG